MTRFRRPVIGRTRRLAYQAVVLVSLITLVPSITRASPVFDRVNPDASPAFSNNTYVHWGSRDAGWYYTPSVTYDLDGIYSRFLQAPDAPVASKTVTVQIRSERPLNGGTVLRQAAFTVNLAAGGDLGGTFAPLRLTAGTKYFVDFLDVQDVGINVATWANDLGGNPQPAGGATTSLGPFYRNFDPSTDFSTVSPEYAQVAGVNIAGGAPILFFTGTAVPEPAVIGPLMAGAAMLTRRRGRAS